MVAGTESPLTVSELIAALISYSSVPLALMYGNTMFAEDSTPVVKSPSM